MTEDWLKLNCESLANLEEIGVRWEKEYELCQQSTYCGRVSPIKNSCAHVPLGKCIDRWGLEKCFLITGHFSSNLAFSKLTTRHERGFQLSKFQHCKVKLPDSDTSVVGVYIGSENCCLSADVVYEYFEKFTVSNK